jgi:hypothetical protein
LLNALSTPLSITHVFWVGVESENLFACGWGNGIKKWLNQQVIGMSLGKGVIYRARKR